MRKLVSLCALAGVLLIAPESSSGEEALGDCAPCHDEIRDWPMKVHWFDPSAGSYQDDSHWQEVGASCTAYPHDPCSPGAVANFEEAARLADKGDWSEAQKFADNSMGLVQWNAERHAFQLISCEGDEVIGSLRVTAPLQVAGL